MQEKQTKLKESTSKTRDTVFAIFLLCALVEVPIALYGVWKLFTLGWGWLGVIIFAGGVTLTICFLMVINWVAEDEKAISSLREQVRELEQERT